MMIALSMGISPSYFMRRKRYFSSFLICPQQRAFLSCQPGLLCNVADVFFSDINALILDYLTMEGYPNAAAKFSKEANLQPQQDGASIRSRQEIQNFIHNGNIQAAIETLNELDPQVRPLCILHAEFFLPTYTIVIKTRVTCTTHSASFLARDEKHHLFMIFTVYCCWLGHDALLLITLLSDLARRSWTTTRRCIFLCCAFSSSSSSGLATLPVEISVLP